MNQNEDISFIPDKSVDESGKVRSEEFVLKIAVNRFIEKLNDLLRKRDRDFTEFTSSDMTGNMLPLIHSIGVKHVSTVALYDNNDVLVLPSNYNYLATGVGRGNLTIYQPVTGQWTVYLKY